MAFNPMTIHTPLCRSLSTAALLSLLLILTSASARADELPKGTVIEKVVCEADPSQSYALYLPSNYSPDKKWPVIYAFDPDGGGNEPVKLYKDAAEKYGYIVAGTYNTQNGMQNAPLQKAISILISDTRKRFSIDEKRVYTTGFSGGARVATRVASSCGGCVAGVIACGAGFPPDIKPSEAIPFVFFATVGVDDFNFPELKRLDDKLGDLKVPHRIATFSGAHEWASSSLFVEAVEWIEIQAMRSGRKLHDDAFISAQWNRSIERAHAEENGKNLLEAYRSYAALSADFKDLKDINEVESKMNSLRATNEVKQAIKDEQEQLKEQLEIARQIIDLGSILLTDPSKRSATVKELQTIVDGLRLKAKSTEDSRERRIARRSIRQVLAQTYEAAAFAYMPRQQYDIALVNLEVAGMIIPDSWGIPYEMARAYSMSGEKKKAVESLRTAVAKGLNDAKYLENQKDFDSVRNEGDFKSIVKRLKEIKPSK